MKQRLWTSVHKELEGGFWDYWMGAWGGKYWEDWEDAYWHQVPGGMFFLDVEKRSSARALCMKQEEKREGSRLASQNATTRAKAIAEFCKVLE